jgi:hypothetical protein
MLIIYALDTQRYAIWREDTRPLEHLASEQVQVAEYAALSDAMARVLGETYEGGLNPAVFGDEIGMGINEPVVLDAARAGATLARVSAESLRGAGAIEPQIAIFQRLAAFYDKCVLKRWTPVAVLATS